MLSSGHQASWYIGKYNTPYSLDIVCIQSWPVRKKKMAKKDDYVDKKPPLFSGIDQVCGDTVCGSARQFVDVKGPQGGSRIVKMECVPVRRVTIPSCIKTDRQIDRQI